MPDAIAFQRGWYDPSIRQVSVWFDFSLWEVGPPQVTLLTRSLRFSNHFPQLRPGDHVIGQLPMYHMYGFTVMWMNLVKGSSMIVMGKFEQKKFLELIQKYKVILELWSSVLFFQRCFFQVPILYIVPPILVFLAKHPLVDQYDLSSVHTFVVRSAPISKELSEEAMKRHRNLKYLLQGEWI